MMTMLLGSKDGDTKGVGRSLVSSESSLLPWVPPGRRRQLGLQAGETADFKAKVGELGEP